MLRLFAPIWRMLPNRLNWWLLGIVHARFMVSVIGVIFDDDGRVLVLRHRFWNGQGWGLPSGYARNGETLEAALARELREETGYEIDDVRLLQVRSGRLPWIEVAFRARLTGGTRHLDSREILAAVFVAPEQLPANIPVFYQDLIKQMVQATPTIQPSE